MTKERPILFSAPMVRAILDGAKTQTRRVSGLEVINAEPDRYEFLGITSGPGIPHFAFHDSESGAQVLVRCKHGEPGDRLWVKETFIAWGYWAIGYSEKKGRDEWHFIDQTAIDGKQYYYEVGDHPTPLPRREANRLGWWRRPAIFMPGPASRILLGNTGVRVERLRDISEADAQAEGARSADPATGRECILDPTMGSYRLHYRKIWEQINRPGSWDANPWVWVIEFTHVLDEGTP